MKLLLLKILVLLATISKAEDNNDPAADVANAITDAPDNLVKELIIEAPAKV